MAGAATGADYGLDAPGVVAGNAAAGVAALAGAGWAALHRRHPVAAAAVAGWLGVWGLVAALQAGLMVRSSRSAKLRERERRCRPPGSATPSARRAASACTRRCGW